MKFDIPKTVGPNGEKYYVDEADMVRALKPYVSFYLEPGFKNNINAGIVSRAMERYSVVIPFDALEGSGEGDQGPMFALFINPVVDEVTGDIKFGTPLFEFKSKQVYDSFIDSFDTILLKFVNQEAKGAGFFSEKGDLLVSETEIRDAFEQFVFNHIFDYLAEQLVKGNFIVDENQVEPFVIIENSEGIPYEEISVGDVGGGGGANTYTITINGDVCEGLDDGCGVHLGVAGERYVVYLNSGEGWYMESATVHHPDGSTENISIGGYTFTYVIPSLDGNYSIDLVGGA